MRRTKFFLSLLALSGFAYGCSESPSGITEPQATPSAEFASAASSGSVAGRGTVLRLLGDAIGYEGTVPDIDGDGEDDPAVCFDLDVLDATGRKIGTATDCLSSISEVGGGLALVGTTIFRLANGTFTSRGYTTVQPVTTSQPTPITHTTGAIPMESSNGIIAGTGAFDNYRAQVRLSGAVNLSRLESDGRIAFDCLFAITPLR